MSNGLGIDDIVGVLFPKLVKIADVALSNSPISKIFAEIVNSGVLKPNITFANISKMLFSGIAALGNLCKIVAGVDDVVVLGAKASQAGVKTASDFSNTNDYVNYLKNEVSLDEDALNKIDDKTRIMYGIVGGSIVLQSVSEKLSAVIPVVLLLATSEAGVKGKILCDLVKAFVDKGIPNMHLVVDYLSNKVMEETKHIQIYEILNNNLTSAEIANMKKTVISEKYKEN